MKVEYEHPDTVIIDGGKISFFIPQYSLRITAKVKQSKGSGVADADYLSECNHYHIDLLNMFLSSQDNVHKVWTANEILAKMRIIKHLQNPKYEFKENNWRRPISEFLRKGILIHPQGQTHRYLLDVEKSKSALEIGKFNQ